MTVGILAGGVDGKTLGGCSTAAVGTAICFGPIVFACEDWGRGEGVAECDDLMDHSW